MFASEISVSNPRTKGNAVAVFTVIATAVCAEVARLCVADKSVPLKGATATSGFSLIAPVTPLTEETPSTLPVAPLKEETPSTLPVAPLKEET